MPGTDAMQRSIELLGSEAAPAVKRHCVRRKSMREFIADLRQQSGVKRVFVVGTLKRPRAAFRNWFSGDVDLFQRQARRASDVAP
jgi:predicted nucleotidyltransferase